MLTTKIAAAFQRIIQKVIQLLEQSSNTFLGNDQSEQARNFSTQIVLKIKQ